MKPRLLSKNLILRSLWLFAGALLLALQACEDDPILSPQHTETKSKGSYGRLEQDSTTAPGLVHKNNPRVF